MSFAEYLKKRLRAYFILVTLIVTAMAIFGLIFSPDQPLYPRDLLTPPVVAALTMLPTFVMYSPKELSTKEMFIRRSVQCGLIEVIVLLLIKPESAPQIDPLWFRVMLGGIVLVVYVLVLVLLWLSAYRESRKLTEGLQRLQAKG